MSTSVFFELPETVQRLHEGPLAACIDAYASRLLEQGFSSGDLATGFGLSPISAGGSSDRDSASHGITPQTVGRYLKTQKDCGHHSNLSGRPPCSQRG